ncbi:MAG: LapA family protein [bacterium]
MSRLIYGVLFATGIAVFVYLNSILVSINLVFWIAPAVPLAIIILFSILLGILLAVFFGFPQYIKNRKKINELENKIKALTAREPTKE